MPSPADVAQMSYDECETYISEVSLDRSNWDISRHVREAIFAIIYDKRWSEEERGTLLSILCSEYEPIPNVPEDQYYNVVGLHKLIITGRLMSPNRFEAGNNEILSQVIPAVMPYILPPYWPEEENSLPPQLTDIIKKCIEDDYTPEDLRSHILLSFPRLNDPRAYSYLTFWAACGVAMPNCSPEALSHFRDCWNDSVRQAVIHHPNTHEDDRIWAALGGG